MRVSHKTKRYVVELYQEIESIAPEYGVDPRVCLLFALLNTGFAYTKLQGYSKLARRLSLKTFDRLYGNNIFMLEGLGTKSAHTIYVVADERHKVFPAFSTREDTIRTFCAIVRRCLGDIRDYDLDTQLLFVWLYGYSTNIRAIPTIINTVQFANEIMPAQGLVLTDPNRYGIIGRKVRGKFPHQRLAHCKRLLAKSVYHGDATASSPDNVFYIPSKTRNVLGERS